LENAADGVESELVSAFHEVHAFNEIVRDGINVPHFAIRKGIATKAFYELMNFDIGNTAFPVGCLMWFHVRIKLLPLTGPVGPLKSRFIWGTGLS
jgi:hypothetical protein